MAVQLCVYYLSQLCIGFIRFTFSAKNRRRIFFISGHGALLVFIGSPQAAVRLLGTSKGFLHICRRKGKNAPEQVNPDRRLI